MDHVRDNMGQRAVTNNQKLTLTFTDHYAVVLEMPNAASGLELQRQLEWNTSKPGVWEAFKKADKSNDVLSSKGFQKI